MKYRFSPEIHFLYDLPSPHSFTCQPTNGNSFPFYKTFFDLLTMRDEKREGEDLF